MKDVKIIFAMMLKDCMEFLDDYFYTGLLTGGLSVVFYFTILICINFFNRNIFMENDIQKCWKLPFIALLDFYCHLVMGITIFSREKGAKYILNLSPFSTWGTDSWHLTLWIENILMLMPLGILLYILWHPFRKLGWSMIIGFCFSLMIECTQLFTRLGKFELDDIVNNVFGMQVVFWVCKGMDRFLFNIRESHVRASQTKIR